MSYKPESDSPFSKQTKVSNLTKNLLSQQQRPQTQEGTSAPDNPPNYLTNFFGSSFQNTHLHQSYPKHYGLDSINYIPSGHNTPTVVGLSYSSNHSYSASYGQPYFGSASQFGLAQPSSQPYGSVNFGSHLFKNSSSLYKPQEVSHAIPTTNISMDTVNSNTFSQSSLPSTRIAHSFPSQPGFQRVPTDGTPELALSNPAPPPAQPQIPTEPDRYMTYKEFFQNLSTKEYSLEDAYEEHLNIVEYPVNDLITMLACLLTKIIEANDKLHPNHFDNTIAIRQKYKDEKKRRRLERQRHTGSSETDAISVDDERVSEDEDDDEDEMKNRYLANVLAFHGTNVPGISLHAYLSRVLKYCPVTNEVFLSLLVYFDRIAKKANNLKLKKKDADDSESEQLFVMDSYNIHRLIILGITVSSKFFSDIFYKNLRYAKVGGLPLEELNYLELQFLLLLDFKLMITVEDLQNYGDLLLKFWKREELTNEIRNESEAQ